ncbi:1,4-alpha-glucan branching protein GlgB [Amorphus orientalis]|uniref:1,4-alpha-glucan branching enzyme GlgB n=1 Tax=Amorphus orientalis TaxID=649198 RepID=A0AAE3VLA6_9HYPH|nr:1,4-alpha-glucan branching protein GlgB [Amorphus orientalis]MDQ0314254.1 1,4-alpha-glucan branching enzyme [Amorphus orientalis]
MPLSSTDIEAIVTGRHGDPFSVLGAHREDGRWTIRAFLPDARRVVAVSATDNRELGELERIHPAGFYAGPIPNREDRPRYRLKASDATATWKFFDPYAFAPVLGPLDDWFFAQGAHHRLYDRLGAHPMEHEGVPGTHFAVWAPNASRVSVVGDFNNWDGRRHPMRKRVDTGVWEIFLPRIGEGTLYKYEILSRDGTLLPLKSDPVGFAGELRPATASRVIRTDRFEWTDDDWMAARAGRDPRRSPMAIYEVHLGSWQRGPDGRYLTYDEIADALVPYVSALGFSHVEFLPVTEHPLDASWGYQPIGLYAPTVRHGDPAGFARLVDRLHGAGIGVLLDWVPAHFPSDEHGLAFFDGGPLYEDADPLRGRHPQWGTAVYDFGRVEVANFLIGSALYWLERFHVDGLRVDAVASMLYLDYGREGGEWRPNAHGGNENLEAVAFLRRLNEIVYETVPGAVVIAEESTAWPGVSQPTYSGGLGFGFKWNMGWMHDTLAYFRRETAHRRHHHNEITFGLLYAFSENFVLPISHDEVVHGKGTLYTRMAGDDWQKRANVRAFLAAQWAYPGKKLLFMGQEFAQVREWAFDRALDWHLLDDPRHAGIRDLVADLNRLYADVPALHVRDNEAEGFGWAIVDDADRSIFAWLRFGAPDDAPVLVVANLTETPHSDVAVPVPRAGRWREVLNTDAEHYGGSGWGNMGGVTTRNDSDGRPVAWVTCPPLATVWLAWEEA